MKTRTALLLVAHADTLLDLTHWRRVVATTHPQWTTGYVEEAAERYWREAEARIGTAIDTLENKTDLQFDVADWNGDAPDWTL